VSTLELPPADRPTWERLQLRVFLVGVVALALCGLGAIFNPGQFFRSYLLAYLFCTGIALGCLAIVMLQHITGGAWGLVIRRLLESATRTLPLLAIGFVPLAFGLPYLYIWARPEAVAEDPTLQHKALYLNVPFFLVRTAGYFAIWLGLMFFLNRWSREEDRTNDPNLPRRFRLLAAPGLGLYGLTITFAAIDWVMSLEPHWYSTIYGVLFGTSQALAAFSFVIAALVLLSLRPPLAGVLTTGHFRDLGNLLLAFVMLWAYMSFSQFMLIWSGNLTEEIPYYLNRVQGGWSLVAVLLAVGQFALPFLLLLSRDVKRNVRVLASVAGLVLFMQFVHLFWLIGPATPEAPLQVHWMDLAALLGVGGVWLAVFLWQLQRWPLLPVHAHLEEAHHHE
jgi:hypothetical protein